MTDQEKREQAFSFLCKRNPFDISQASFVCLLMNYEEVIGENAILDLAGFYLFALDNYKDEQVDMVIKAAFAHDLNEYKTKFMLPRTDGYREFFNL